MKSYFLVACKKNATPVYSLVFAMTLDFSSHVFRLPFFSFYNF